MTQGEEAEAGAHGREPGADALAAILRFDRADQHVEGGVEKKQQEHLGQAGDGVLPHHVAKDDESAGKDGNKPVEEAAGDKELDHGRLRIQVRAAEVSDGI
jgi:hypothetical protein